MTSKRITVPTPPPAPVPGPKSDLEYSRLERLKKSAGPPFYIHTSNVFDPLTLEFQQNVSFKIDPVTGLIVEVTKRSSHEITPGDNDIDLRGKFVLPGFVDAHTHIFLHSYDECDNAKQKTQESLVERVIRSVNHCKIALMAGYTTYRDLGSNGMQEADTNVRDAINRGLTIGPRLFVATKELSSTLGFANHTENRLGGTQVPATSEDCDGVIEVRKAVRRRVGLGCDVVKFFADYRKRVMRFPPAQQHPYLSSVMFPPENPNPDVILFTQEEMNVICEEAKNCNCPCAAHCATNKAVQMASKAGVVSIEHGSWCDTETLQVIKENNSILVPTLTVAERLYGPNFVKILKKTYTAWEMGVLQACGGDTGTFSHGDNIREAELFVKSGIPVEDTLRCLTYNGWLACGDYKCGRMFGWLDKGTAADIVAVDEDPRKDISALRKIAFVMKDGKVYKKNHKCTV